ncbi:hypothetical protein [Sporosarcina sp. Te-1]|uniref:hypothetical protein n=1 Tax=Sporosarcina sp. Te-1 TaxID=2818390 RepID=UPI001A9D6C2F|nr:hypothetical protein [Sporosarcina sp. Te-1]QTD41798.1 hypothetical protein J3U78_02795 [Sporosarcina sp. Te-1]
MKQAETLQDFQTFADEADRKGEKGIIYVNQSNKHFEEPLLSDEDTAGRAPMQLLRVILKVGGDSIFWEYPFFNTAELEEVNVQLEPIYKHFTKQVIELEEALHLIEE